jgi:hypothetical protein
MHRIPAVAFQCAHQAMDAALGTMKVGDAGRGRLA